MRQFWLVVLPLLVGGFVTFVVWRGREEPRARYVFLLATLGSILLAYEALLFSLCGLGENNGSHCGGSSDDWVLLGIPLLFLTAWRVSAGRDSLSLLLGAVVLAVVLL